MNTIDKAIKLCDAKQAVLRVSSEHTGGRDGYYGYISTTHPDLGSFYVSVSIKGKVQYDGYPWKFIGALNSKQADFVRKNEAIYKKLGKSGWGEARIDTE